MKKRMTILSAGLVGALLFSGCNKPATPPDRSGGAESKTNAAAGGDSLAGKTPVEIGNIKKILHRGNGAEPQGLDPHTVTGVPEHRILHGLLEGLVSGHPKTLEPTPGVAESWAVNDELTVYTFTLRKNAKWSNGDPVTSADFMFSFQRILSPKLASEYAYMLHIVKNAEAYNKGDIQDFTDVGFKAPDAHTLVVTLKAPTPYFLNVLNHYSWFPVHKGTVLAHGAIDERATDWTKAGNFVGNGAFTLDRWKFNEVIIAKKSPTYWDRDKVELNEIHFYPIQNLNTEELKFRTGGLHVTSTMPIPKIKVYKKKHPELMRSDILAGTYFYRFNVTKKPLDDARVRRALSMAINREEIVNLINGGQKPAYYFTPPDTAGFTSVAKVTEDVEAAKKLLAEAGFPNGEGFPKCDILYNVSEDHKMVALVIQQQWKKHLNIDVKLYNQDWKVYLESQDKLDYYICRAGWNADFVDPYNFLDMWLTKGGNNDTGWTSEAYDALINQASVTAEKEARYELYQKAEKLLLEEGPIMPIYFYVRNYGLQKSVKGWEPNLLDTHPYKYIHLEE